MIHDGRVKALPLVEYLAPKAAVEAVTPVEAGMVAVASDTEAIGYYAGSAWRWLAVAGGKTLSISNTMTLAAAADDQTYTFPAASTAIPGGSGAANQVAY